MLSPAYKFKTKDRILLAHNVSLAYWQLFGSDLTRNIWTSDTIWFMEQESFRVTQDNSSPLTSCLTFEFDAACDQSAQQQIGNTPVHEFPGILSIGIILLEIALSIPFPPLRLGGTSSINKKHQIANARLEDLKTKKWDCFPSKWIFDAAVEECLNFKVSKAKHVQSGKPLEQIAREEFYTKVVCRLAYLVESGFKSSPGGRVCPKRQGQDDSVTQDESRGEFQTGTRLIERNWLQNLKRICHDVEQERQNHDISTPIKVAILDTGCDLSLLPSAADGDTVKWKDFAEESNQHRGDAHGHGTLMARLVLECAPSAELIVARIAKDLKGLQGKQPQIAEVRGILFLNQAQTCRSETDGGV